MAPLLLLGNCHSGKAPLKATESQLVPGALGNTPDVFYVDILRAFDSPAGMVYLYIPTTFDSPPGAFYPKRTYNSR